MAFRMAHHSGRYDKMQVAKAFGEYTKNATFVAHTEFANEKRKKMLADACSKAGWGMFSPREGPYDECCFTWDTAKWEFVESAQKIISNIIWYSASTGNPMPRFTAVAVLMRHKATGELWAFLTCHTPSHVTTWTGFRPLTSNRVKCYRDGIKNLGKWVESLVKKWKPVATVVTADWNAPCEQKWFRDWLEAQFPKPFRVMGPNAGVGQKRYPDTHDSRCIDWAVLGPGAKKKGQAVARRVSDSDHKTLFFTLQKG